MIITTLGYFLIPSIAIIYLFLDLKKALMLTYILSTFTTLSIVNITMINYSVAIGYYAGLLLILKVFIEVFRGKIKFPKKVPYLPAIFAIICAISLLYPKIFSNGIIVLTPNNRYEPIRLNIQMLTQYIYLLFGIVILYVSCIIYHNIQYTEEDFVKSQKYLSCSFIVFLLLQIIMSVDKYNYYFRNNNAFNDQTISGMVRLSGPTMEASVLCMICVPALAVLILSNKRKIKIHSIIISIVLLALLLKTRSSTLVIGLIIILGSLLISFLKNLVVNKRISKVLLISFCVFSIMLIIFSNYIITDFSDIIQNLFVKVQGEGTSGQLRLISFRYHINVFKEHWLTGVGFGTIRSYDLFSGWLASIGVLGVMTFLGVIFKIIINCFEKGKGSLLSLFVFLTVIIMFISVPEPYYIYIWIVLGLGEGMARNNKSLKKNN